jgi:DNA segregation ATPase FtsK/SpoIIIE, S-DNA-T family
MSNWWKRFFGLDDDERRFEDDPEHLNGPNNLNNSFPRAKGRFEDPGRRLEVKMVNQYPTTNQKKRSQYEHKTPKTNSFSGSMPRNRSVDSFDEPAYLRKSQHSLHRPAEHSYNVSRQEEGRSRPYQHKTAGQRNNEQTENKKKAPFRPTNVPSPIYGYQPRKDYQKPLTVIEQEILPTTEDAVEVNSDSLVVEDLNINHQPIREKESEANHWDDFMTEEVAAGEELAGFEEVEIDPFVEPPIEEVSIEPLIEKQEPDAEQKNSAVPYNVLMFGADRHALRQKQQQNTPSMPESFPGNHVQKQSEKPSINENSNRNAHTEVSNNTAHQTIHMSASSSVPKDLPLHLFQDPPKNLVNDLTWINEKQEILKQVLKNFNVHADIVTHVQGPTVTRFEIRLHPGVKVSKVIGLTEDIKLSMAAEQIRIAPVAGKNTVGIEIPNEKRKPVFLKTLLQSDSFKVSTAPLTAALGIDISGKEVVTDLSKMPHGLIAGATGSGKSVCIHSLILSLIYKSDPDSLRLVLIDPKVVELAMYQRLPHLAAPVINQPKDAALALRWAVDEMERRYQAFADIGVRDIKKYNQTVGPGEKWPYIVIIIDELADLMMVSPQDVEESICRIAQKARAAGIHLLLATQRPSVDVITGLIKANIPTRIAFGVSSQADSRTILDSGGAERLLGQGDMLFAENGSRDIQRLQGAFVSDEEIDHVMEFLTSWPSRPYLFDPVELREQRHVMDDEDDELYQDAANFVIDQGQASVSSLQRRFRIGYNRAARLIDCLEANDVISEANGSKPRQVLMTKEMFAGNEYE